MIELRAEGHLVRTLPDFVQLVEALLLGTRCYSAARRTCRWDLAEQVTTEDSVPVRILVCCIVPW